MTVMENRTLMWQADLDQELQKLTQEISHVLGAADAAPSASSDEDDAEDDDASTLLWRQELRQMRLKLVEVLKLLINASADDDGNLTELLAKMKSKDDGPGNSDRNLRSRELALRKREEALLAKEKKLAERMKAPVQAATSEALLAKEKELLDFKEKQLQEREQALQREKQLQQDREHSFHAREKLLLEREVSLQTEKKLHQEREQFLQSKERQQQEREEALQAQKKVQQDREDSLDAMERRLERRTAAAPELSEAAEAPKARRQPKRKAEPPAAPAASPPSRRNVEAGAKDRSSRSRERALPEEDHPKTKRRKAPYLTLEELRWDWLQREVSSTAPTSTPAVKTTEFKGRKAAKKAAPAPAGRDFVKDTELMAALKAPTEAATELPWDTDLMVELDEVAPPSAPPPAPPPVASVASAFAAPDADLMVELDEAEEAEALEGKKNASAPSEAPQAEGKKDASAPSKVTQAAAAPAPAVKALESSPKEVTVAKAAPLDPSYAVNDLEEEDLFGEDEAEARYVPPNEKMSSMPPPQRIPHREKPPRDAEKNLTPAGGAAKNKKRDWYQRHYPGQVAPREATSAAKSHGGPASNRPHVATPSWRHGKPPGTASASTASASAANRSSDLDWAYAPLKGQQSKTNNGFRPASSDGLPSIDDVLPML